MEIPDKIDSKFRFVLLAAHRAEQMVRGARPKVETPGRKPTRSAMHEILDDRIEWGYGPPPAPEPAPDAESAPAEA
jgi:DNA-directed RNA polymerase omega subunit